MAGVNFDFEFQLCKWRSLVRLIVGNDGAGPVFVAPGAFRRGRGGMVRAARVSALAPGPRAVEFWATSSRTGGKGLETISKTPGLKNC